MVSSVEIYDPRLNAWRMGDPMSSPRGYAAAVNLDGSVYLIGGLQSNVLILDTVSNDAVLSCSYLLSDKICAHSVDDSSLTGGSLQPELRMVSSRIQFPWEEVLCICRRHVVTEHEQESSVHNIRFNIVLPLQGIVRVRLGLDRPSHVFFGL